VLSARLFCLLLTRSRTVCLALEEAKAAYRVWLDIRAKRDEMLTEKQNKKPAPYKHVKVDIVFSFYSNDIF